MTEEYFPRGGKKPNVTYFKQSSNFLGAAEKGQGKKKKIKKKAENDDGYLSDEAVKEVDQSYKMCAAGIGYKTLKPGVNVLGRVSRVLDTKLIIMMPGKTEGCAMACHISEPYNKLLEAYVNDETEKVRDLRDMFSLGQYVAAHVLEGDGSNEGVMLSLMPQHINSARKHDDLHKGDILQAAVSSVEDHGYVMDLGIANTRAFLPKAEADPDVELDTGVLTWLCVKSVTTSADNSIVTSSSAPAALQKAVRRKRGGALLPGSAVEFIVDKSLDNGIEGRVLGDVTAYAQRFHVDRDKGKKPKLGQKIRAHVLYVMPTRHTPFLTTRDIFQTARPDLEAEMKYKEGDIIEEAKVLKIAGRSIHFKLGGCVGTMSMKRVAVHEELSDEQVVAQSYPIGSSHKVRVLLYNLSDYVYHVSDEAGVLRARYFCLAQLRAGERVPGRVRAVGDAHVTVAVGRLTGHVSQMHLYDTGIYVDPKKATNSKLAKKKYKVGQEVTARVISVDPVKQSLQLTLKPSLIAPDAKILTSYEEAEMGKAYTGVIKIVKDFVLVSFLGDVIAYVPKNQVCNPPVKDLSGAFHPGQVVNCTVLKVDPGNKKILGSLIVTPFWPEKESDEFRDKRRNHTDDNELPKKKRRTSENEDNEEKKSKKVGQEMISLDSMKQTLESTLKASLNEADAETLTSYEEAEIGKAYTGVIKVVKDYVLVSFLGDVVAYVPKTQVCRPPVEDLRGSFHIGQVVTCTILQVNPGDKKMLGSLVIAPFWPAKQSEEHRDKQNQTSESNDSGTKKNKKMGQEVSAVDPMKQSLESTLKASLNEADAETLTSYEEAEIGKAYTGVIKVVKDYVLVSFLGDVVAYVPRTQVCRPPVEDLRGSFHIGQVVTCTILQVNPGDKKMLGSLVITPFWPAKHINEHREKRGIEMDDNEVPRKKRKTTESDDNETKKNKKVKKSKAEDVSEESEAVNTELKKKKDKKDKLVKTKDVSEESDAIETDIYEDSDQVLKPEDLALIDLSDCETAKQWKKRVVSLMKSIRCRLHRIKKIDTKIMNIEEQGLNAENKKYHTAMHQEKLVIEERVKKLMEAMKTAQENLEQFDETEYRDPDYKEKQKLRKEEKKKLKAEMREAANNDDTDDETVSKTKKNKKDKLKRKLNNEAEKPKVEKGDKKKKREDKNSKEAKEVIVDKSKDIQVVDSLEPVLEMPSAKDFWSETQDLANNVAEESSSSGEDEETEQPKKKRKKLTAAEKVAKARAEEERLRELERRAVESEAQPRSCDQFERALLASPDCSQLWIAYMAFHLQSTEIDKARAVGRKALNTISFREEQEKLNVWLAMLNFENRFGTKESQQKTLEEALQMNDTFKVHSKLLDIYSETSKTQELSTLVDLMLRKYKKDPSTYIQCGAACFKLGLVDKARQVMQKAVGALQKKEHVSVLVQFALLERSHGARERAEALFEQVLAVYPQRADVCSAYVDMLAKAGDMDAVRQVMERMTSQKLPARKIKILYNKWAEVEERAGDPERAERVRERAVKFMETAKF